MIQGVQSQSGAAQAAIEAALRAHEAASKRIEAQMAAASGGAAQVASSGPDFAKLVAEGVRSAGQQVTQVDSLPADMLAGKVSDFHEIAARIKQSELTYKFALEVRNKLIDAYRETMRMSV